MPDGAAFTILPHLASSSEDNAPAFTLANDTLTVAIEPWRLNDHLTFVPVDNALASNAPIADVKPPNQGLKNHLAYIPKDKALVSNVLTTVGKPPNGP